MRILPELQRQSVLKEVCDFVGSTTQFQLPDCNLHVQVIPGETEGLYGWIAANYLLGGFDQPKDHDHGKGHNTYGFLDMGGASAQIAFAPNATEAEKHANDLTLLRLRAIDGTSLEYKVFVTTWLGYGVNQARERYVKALLESSASKELPDPCLPSGLKIEVTKEGRLLEPANDDEAPKQTGVAHLLGTGKFQECLHQTNPLLAKEKACTDTPCLINGQHVPAIDFDVNHFVGVSEYWHTTHEIFEKGHKDKAYDFKTYQERVSDFCHQDWKDIEQGISKSKWGNKVDEEKAREVCFKASWIINMLHDGIGVPRVGIEPLPPTGKNGTKAVHNKAKEKGFLDPFQAVNKINDVEVSWTLGKMVLYASSEVDMPSPDALAVGFGSNEPGIPKDFQYPGGVFHPYESSNNWYRLFVEHPQKVPAFFLMIFIFCFIIGLIIGKERRARLWAWSTKPFRGPTGKDPLHRRRGRSFPAKLFGLGGNPSYERVDLENPDAANDFELQDTYLESSDSDEGQTSGWATPNKAKDGNGYFGAGDVLGQGHGVGLGLTGRGGLISRTDSREMMRSRASSPKRREGKRREDD